MADREPRVNLGLKDSERRRLQYASYVLDDLALIFVETPKAACTSFKHAIAALSGVDFCSMQRTQLAAHTPELTIHDRGLFVVPALPDLSLEHRSHVLSSAEYLRFCVVRNPYLRLASAWLDRFMCHSLSPLAPILRHLELPAYRPDWGYLRLRFAEFIDHLHRAEWPSFTNHHWQSQTSLLLPHIVNYSLVIRVEELNRTIPLVIEHVETRGGTWPGLPRFNDTPIPATSSLYTAATARKVYTMFEMDFITYDYPAFNGNASGGVRPLPPVEHIVAIQKRNQRISRATLTLKGMP